MLPVESSVGATISMSKFGLLGRSALMISLVSSLDLDDSSGKWFYSHFTCLLMLACAFWLSIRFGDRL